MAEEGRWVPEHRGRMAAGRKEEEVTTDADRGADMQCLDVLYEARPSAGIQRESETNYPWEVGKVSVVMWRDDEESSEFSGSAECPVDVMNMNV